MRILRSIPPIALALAACLLLPATALAAPTLPAGQPAVHHAGEWCGTCHSFTAPAPAIPPKTARPAGHLSNPTCTSCHTTNNTPPPAIPQNAVRPHPAYGTCTTCHTYAASPPPVPVTRMSGADRYGTCYHIAQTSHASTVPAVVLATGEDFPDALCAAPLAKAYGGPVLLTKGSALSTALRAELMRLRPAKVFIVGSAGVVPQTVADAVAGLPWAPAVTRLGGATRYDTAGLVADQVKAKVGSASTVVVANGASFADALSVAPLAAAKGWPILLSRADVLPAPTAAAVGRLGATSTLVVGGTGAVGTGVASQLPSVTRKGGATRWETCALIADHSVANGSTFQTLGLATGVRFPDALSAGPALAGRVLMLLPASGIPAPVAERIAAHKADVKAISIAGGTGAVSDASVNAVGDLLR